MARGTTIFDLDDTLIVEEEVARSSLRRWPDSSPARTRTGSRRSCLTTARRLWRAGPCYPLCPDLGIASWEGLWSTFEGGHRVLDDLTGLGPRLPARGVASRALATLGSEDAALASAMADAYVECQRRRPPAHRRGRRQRRGRSSGTRRLGLLTNGPADIQRLKFDGTGLADCFDAVGHLR